MRTASTLPSRPPSLYGWAKRVAVEPAAAVLAGLAVAALCAALTVLAPAPYEALRLMAADFVFVREPGLRLGARPLPERFVLVRWDPKSTTALGGVLQSSVQEDLQVYAALLAAGAAVIADTRPVPPSEPGLKDLLDGMARLDGSRLLREIQPPDAPWFTEGRDAYLSHIGLDPFFIGGIGRDVTERIRFYPLLHYTPAEGFDESLALKVVRAALGLPRAADVPRLARSSGIAADWAIRAGQPPPPGAEQQPRQYPLGPRGIPWVSRAPAPDEPVLLISPAALWIDYGSPPAVIATLSYVDVLQGDVPREVVQDRLVIIDSTGTAVFPNPRSDQRATAGELVAIVVQNILDDRFLQPASGVLGAALVFLGSLLGGLSAWRLRPLVALVPLAATCGLYLAAAVGLYRAGTFPDLVAPLAACVGSAVAAAGVRFGQEERARRRIYDLFGRYVPRAVVTELVRKSDREALLLGGTRREITVLFADIRGFTAFSEEASPEEVIRRLNALLAKSVSCVFEYHGTVDKYIGDALMVLFNAPLDQPDHAERGVRAAVAIQRAIAGQESLAFGIGIHTGEAVVGNVGTPERLEYTAIGSTVNLAARLCELAGPGDIVISETCWAATRSIVEAERLPPRRVKGVRRDLVTYRVSGLRAHEASGSHP